MPYNQPREHEIAPSVRALLTDFHTETRYKLALAPADSAPIHQSTHGAANRVTDGWISDSDADLDKTDAITITPTSVRDIETQ